MKLKAFVLFFIVFFFSAFSLFSQEQRTEADSLYSQTLKEVRPIQIVYPKNYDAASGGKYELVFCLDGIPSALKLETAFLQSEGFIPEKIIMVGIPNVSAGGVSMRDRDLTPTRVYGNTGGADRFLLFLKAELMPYLKGKLPLKPSGHSLYGASLAGLFTMYTFLSDPGLFSSYMAVDPSLWWDNFSLGKLAAGRFGAMGPLKGSLWIAGREGVAFRSMGIAGMDSVLRSSAPAGLRWKCTSYADETHYSTMFKGYWDGMKFSYGGFYAAERAYPASRKIIIKPLRGIVLKDKAFPFICSNVGAGSYLGFTTDGSAPSFSSLRLSGQETAMRLSADAEVRVGSFGIREEYNKQASASFKVGAVLPALKAVDTLGLRPGGLKFAFFAGDWDALPDFGKLKADSSGLAGRDFDLNGFRKDGGFVCVMDGFLRSAKAGYYIFTKVDGNDDSKVFVGNGLVLGSVRGFLGDNEESYILPLEKGFYPVRIVYWRRKAGKALQPIYIKPEGMDDFPLPLEMLFSKGN